MLTLYHLPGAASLTPHLVLRELGLPFELRLVNRDAAEHKSAEYLRLNPNGLVPVLTDGQLVLYETAAIVLHLVDSQPAAGLAPPLGSSERAHFYKWMVWLSNSLQVAARSYFYPEQAVGAGHPAAADVKAAAEARIESLFDQVEAHLATHGGPWMMGARFSAVDPYTFMLGRWTRAMRRPARTLPHVGPFLQRVLERPATRETLAAEGLQPPWI
jgi:glutathione S-transferase